MLQLRGLRRVFNPSQPDEKVALDGLDLVLSTGEFGVVIGSNGAGKSTMLNAVAGGVSLDQGQITVDTEDVTAWPVHQRAKLIARVFQDPMKGTAPGMTIAENMLLAELRGVRRHWRHGLNAKRLAHYKEWVSMLGLGLENRMQARVDLLSGGQRQSLSLIMAVCMRPAVLLLDEHTAALDPKTADLVMTATIRAVQQFKLTTLMVTHNMQHALEFGGKVIMMDAGRVQAEISAHEKRRMTVSDLVSRFSVKSDRALLSTGGA